MKTPQPITLGDLSVEISEACNRFFKRRGMMTSDTYFAAKAAAKTKAKAEALAKSKTNNR